MKSLQWPKNTKKVSCQRYIKLYQSIKEIIYMAVPINKLGFEVTTEIFLTQTWQN